jgi:lysine 6-dehydrogenase
MKLLVLGCGIQGRASAFDLARTPEVTSLVLVDRSREQLAAVSQWLNNPKISTTAVNAADVPQLQKIFRGFDAIVNAAPYEFSLGATRAAIAEGVSLVDLGGDTTVVRQQLLLTPEAEKKNITVIPDCGVGPGITNAMVGHGMEQMDVADEVWIRDGGLPQFPVGPLAYTKLFSIDVLLNEYTGITTEVRDFEIREVEALSGLETIELPLPVGKCEAAHGMGMLSTLPWTYQGRIRNMDNKLIRYPGHLPFFQTLRSLGFLSAEKLEGLATSPREIAKGLLEKALDQPKVKDLYQIQVNMKGTIRGKPIELAYSLVDYADELSGLSAMARTTGFTASIVAQMLAKKEILIKGVVPPEIALPKEKFFQELSRRGFSLTVSQKK